MTDDTTLYRAFALDPKRPFTDQFAGIIDTCRQTGLSGHLLAVVPEHEAQVIAPRNVSVQAHSAKQTVLVAKAGVKDV